MTLFQSLILGAIEGVTEFLPISSTAHILLAQKLMGIAISDSAVTFTIAVQLGSILSAAILYYKYFLSVQNSKSIILALLPTLIIGFVAHPFIKTLFSNVIFIMPWTLTIGGIFMLLGEKSYSKGPTSEMELTLKQKVFLGFAQTLAIVPGVSRSGAMIVAGLFAGLKREALTSFTFILAIPTMFAATAYDIYKSEVHLDIILSQTFVVGFAAAFFVSLISVKAMLFFVRKYTFKPFAWYRIILGLVIFVFVYF